MTINTDLLSAANLVDGTVPARRCFFERTNVVVDPYGNVVPCLFFDGFALGDVRTGALDRSWETRERLRFRRCRDKAGPALCRHCIMSVIRNQTGYDVIRRAYMTGSTRPL